ncbi:MAG: 30S ribosomal protein S17 [bacterium]|nr:30S ribosomal protein S17 [bacterium]
MDTPVKKRKLKGTVVSNKMAKTVVVKIGFLKKHPKYGKYFKRSTRLKAHAENSKDYGVGDLVMIEETRPLSKEKRWKVIQLITPAKKETSDEEQEEKEEK